MAGSHEVRGSIPLGSTTDTRGARRRRRAPLFVSRAHRTERAYRTKSVSHSGAPARAGAPFSFARTRRPHSSARAESAPPPRMGIARPGRAPAPRARRPRRTRSGASRRSTTGRGRVRRSAASAPPSPKGPIGPRKAAARRRRKGRRRNRGGFGFGGGGFANPGIGGLPEALDVRRPLSRGAARAATPPSSPPTGPRRRGPSIGGRPPASAGSAASPTHASGGAAGRWRIRRWAAWAPRSSGTRDCPREERLAGRRGSAVGSDAPSSLAISEAPSPSAPLPMRRKKRRERRNSYLANP